MHCLHRKPARAKFLHLVSEKLFDSGQFPRPYNALGITGTGNALVRNVDLGRRSRSDRYLVNVVSHSGLYLASELHYTRRYGVEGVFFSLRLHAVG